MWKFLFSGKECGCCSHTDVQVPPLPTGYVVTPRLSSFPDVMGEVLTSECGAQARSVHAQSGVCRAGFRSHQGQRERK